MSACILLVEDDKGLRELLQDELEGEGYQVDSCHSAESARQLLQQQTPDLVISDLRLPGADGLSLIPLLDDMHPRPALLVITAFGSVQQAVEALKAGADDFLTKPMEMDHFLLRVTRLLETRSLRDEVQRYRSALNLENFHGLLGQSQVMQRMYEEIRRVAAAGGPVLILGASGTGKELVARAIHTESERAKQRFLAVNCGGIPADLIESEFFGHTAGAFTGAGKSRAGLFQQADGGTLMLDEIGEMPLTLQAKLLRTLQDGRIRPVGSDQETQLDVRLITATNRDLAGMVQEKTFRDDLFYRLETFAIQVPPLHQRGEDILLLANHFLTQFAVRKQRHVQGFSDAALEVLSRYHYPGNVRELQNAVERAVTFCEGKLVEPRHLPQRILEAQDRRRTTEARPLAELPELRSGRDQLLPLDEVQRRYIHHVLEAVNGNKRKAAEILGITRRTLYRWLEK